MSRRKEMAMLVAGIVTGAAVFGGGTALASLTAQPSAQPWADAPFLIIVSINPAQRDTISGFPGTGYGPFPRALRNGRAASIYSS